MKTRLLIVSGLVLFGGNVSASTSSDNPFLRPSEREALVIEQETNFEIENQCSEEFVRGMAEQLAKEIEMQEPPQFQPEVLGNWTRREVEESKYIGETNGVKVYFNERLKQYIYLDITKAKNKGL